MDSSPPVRQHFQLVLLCLTKFLAKRGAFGVLHGVDTSIRVPIMLQTPPAPPKRTNRRWTEDEVLTLLFTLNSNIEQIRNAIEEDRSAGIQLAALLLSKAVGNDCGLSRAVSKIEHIWKECGPSDVNKSDPTNPMYRTGAWTRTLPYLDALYPGMLGSLALASRKEQSAKDTPDNRLPRTKTLRRREEDEMTDPIQCVCGFAIFASSCVHCAKCPTWQHIWCYYREDKKESAPKYHMCHECASYDDEGTLEEEFQRLSLECHERISTIEKIDTKGPIGIVSSLQGGSWNNFVENDDALLFGLSDREVSLTMQFVTSMIRSISHSVDTEDFQFHLRIPADPGDHTDLCEAFRQGGHMVPATGLKLSSLDQFLLLRAVMGSAIWTWSFDGSSTTAMVQDTETMSEALLIEYQRAMIPHDSDLLRYVHRKAWSVLLRDRPDTFERSFQKQAEQYAKRLLCILSSLLQRSKASNDSRPLNTADDWMYRTKNGLSRFNALSKLFLKCIKLKYSLPLTENCYEMYFPTSLESRFVSSDPEDCNRRIKFCFAPAILEYSPENFDAVEQDGSVLFGRKSLIHATDEQREGCRIVCSAVGMFS